MTDQASIRLAHVSKVFGNGPSTVHAVSDLTLDIGAGEIVALLGPNGAGKTTTLDMVLGFTTPTSGVITVCGLEPIEAVRAGHVSAVLQTGGLLRDLEVGETVALVASTHAAPPPISEVLDRAGIDHIANTKVQDCSGGEQQRLRFALALLAEPDLLILDEPTAGMDVSARQAFWEVMRQEAARGCTIVFATHYLHEAEDVAERTVLIADGRLVADGPTDDIRRQAGGRSITARFPVEHIDAALQALSDHPVVLDVQRVGDRLSATSCDPDIVARVMLDSLAAFDLEISSASLERAFLALTTATTTSGSRS